MAFAQLNGRETFVISKHACEACPESFITLDFAVMFPKVLWLMPAKIVIQKFTSDFAKVLMIKAQKLYSSESLTEKELLYHFPS
jgi:hypothetical protein